MDLLLPPVMGHRGAAGLAPENTLASIRRARQEGLSWIEFDVMLTGDGVPVLFHDDSLLRTTGRAALIAEARFDEIRELDVGTWFAPQFADERIPALEQAIGLMRELGLCQNVEIKPTLGSDVATAVAVVRHLESALPEGAGPSLVSSFSRMSLAAVRALRPSWPLAVISWELPLDWAETLQALGAVSLHLWEQHLSADTVALVKNAGYQLASYTVNDPQRARALAEMGVDCIITDLPDRILPALGAAGTSASGDATPHPAG